MRFYPGEQIFLITVIASLAIVAAVLVTCLLLGAPIISVPVPPVK
jgi:hypothetical protein